VSIPNFVRFTLCLLLTAAFTQVEAAKRTMDALADQADAVVIGDVQAGQQSGHSVFFILAVSRTVKGGVQPGAALNVQWQAGLRMNGQLPGGYGLFFLRKNLDGSWTLLPVAQGQFPFEGSYVPMPRTNAPPIASSSSLASSDVIASELETALERYEDRRQLYRLGSALFGIGDTPTTAAIFDRLSANTDRELKLVGLSGLVATDNVSALTELAANLDVLPNATVNSLVLGAIRSVRNPSPASVQALGKLASSSNSTVQESAGEALCFIHTQGTLPFLAMLLDSSDMAVREHAMRGLSRFVNNFPVTTWESIPSGRSLIPQGPAPYRTSDTDRYSLATRALDPTQESAFLQFWRSWWVNNKDKLVPK
jgi:hypothetical protein